MTLIEYAILIALIAALFVLVLRWQPGTLRCDCGRPATRLASDGQLECEACVERRMNGRAPRGGN